MRSDISDCGSNTTAPLPPAGIAKAPQWTVPATRGATACCQQRQEARQHGNTRSMADHGVTFPARFRSEETACVVGTRFVIPAHRVVQRPDGIEQLHETGPAASIGVFGRRSYRARPVERAVFERLQDVSGRRPTAVHAVMMSASTSAETALQPLRGFASRQRASAGDLTPDCG